MLVHVLQQLVQVRFGRARDRRHQRRELLDFGLVHGACVTRPPTHARVRDFDDGLQLFAHFLLLVLQLFELRKLLVVETDELVHRVALGDVLVLDQVRDEVLVRPPSAFSRF